MSGLQRRDDGLLLQLSSAEMARIDALSARLGLNGLTDDSVGAVIGRPVRIAVLDASLLARQFWLMLTVLAPSWELVAVAESVEDLQAQLAEVGHEGADVVLANPTGLCSSCQQTSVRLRLRWRFCCPQAVRTSPAGSCGDFMA